MRSFKIFVIAIIASLLLVTNVSALNTINTEVEKTVASGKTEDTAKDIVAEADSAYVRGEYDKAVELYNTIASTQGVSTNLYVNLGNAQYKRGNTGGAVISYLRALRLDPSNKVAKSNLNFIRTFVLDNNRTEVGDKKISIENDTPTFWKNIYNHITLDHLPDTWSGWAVGCFLLLIAALCCYIFSHNVILRKVGFFGGMIMLCATVILLICASSAARAWEKNDIGVILENKTSLRSSATDTAKLVATPLHGGTEMEVISEDNVSGTVWYECKLNSQVHGWLPKGELELVAEPQ